MSPKARTLTLNFWMSITNALLKYFKHKRKIIFRRSRPVTCKKVRCSASNAIWWRAVPCGRHCVLSTFRIQNEYMIPFKMTKKWLPIDQAHVKKYLLNRLIKGGTFQKKNLDTSSYNFTRENHRNKIYLLIRFVMGKFNINLLLTRTILHSINVIIKAL